MQGKGSVNFAGAAVCAAIVLAVTGAVLAVVRSEYRGAGGPALGPEFNYDLSALRHVDPALINYVEKAPIQSGLKNVSAIAIGPSDQVYVAGDSIIRVF